MTQPNSEFANGAAQTAKAERDIQAEIDVKERRSFIPDDEARPAMQAGAREYPAT